MKIKGVFLAAILTAVLCFSGNLLAYSGGTGEPNDPYQIADANDLLALAADTNDYDKCFILTADVNLQGQVFTKAIIAANNRSDSFFEGSVFAGTFDGKGHRVAHFTINGGTGSRLGLFGYVSSSGSIKNLGLENCDVSGRYYVGDLAGSSDGSISNCYSTGSANGCSDSYYIGGLVGSSHGSMSNCSSTGMVSGSSSVGGLTGVVNGSSISDCYSTGMVSGSLEVGGLVGYNMFGNISNCYSTGSVGNSGAGGLVGFNVGRVICCYSTGVVSGTTHTGGLVGYNYTGSVIRSFWDTQTSGRTTSAGGTGKTTAQMMTLSTFTSVGWDFVGETANGTNDYWLMCVDGVDYPRLAWENQLPLSNAGAEQTVYAWIDGFADVTLDGSDSNDADGDELTYKWTWTIGGEICDATGVNPTIELPIRVHTIQLVVNDGYADSAPDDVNVTVVAPLKGSLKITPQTINRKSNQPDIRVSIKLPEGIAVNDVNTDEPLILYPGGVEAARQSISAGNGISAFFDKAVLMAVVPDGNIELKVAGKLKSGQYFYGRDTVRIIH